MKFSSNKKNVMRWGLILLSFIILVFILWNTYLFFQTFKLEERQKMQNWAVATNSINAADENTDIGLAFEIVKNNNSIPIIKIQGDTISDMVNVSEDIVKDKEKALKYVQKLKSQNEPIILDADGKQIYLYYGDSELINQLKYYPIALILIVIFFSGMIFSFYRADKFSSQNRLWAGMAKETAHQIGTPLSSLLGWIEILKMEDVSEDTVTEIQKDVDRLQTIADRFSKIGSAPKLEVIDLVKSTKESFIYLSDRLSKQIEFTFEGPEYPIMIPLNHELHSWVIENLVKNGIDAMKGKGKINLRILESERYYKIQVSDTGKGIPKNIQKTIFEPGYTTKKRGWGLGLSLTKRIVETYHNGKIKVIHSEIDKGTVFQISFAK